MSVVTSHRRLGLLFQQQQLNNHKSPEAQNYQLQLPTSAPTPHERSESRSGTSNQDGTARAVCLCADPKVVADNHTNQPGSFSGSSRDLSPRPASGAPGPRVPFDGTRSICHACWHRIDSDIRNQHRSPSPAILPAVGASVNVPQFTRVANTSRHCMMTRCNNLQLRRVPNSIKVYLLSYFGLYIPDQARICQLHLQNTSLEEFSEITAHQHTDFNVDSFVDMVNMYTRALESRSRLDLENINEVSEDDLRYWTGLNHSQFEQLFQQVPSLHRQSVTPRTDLGVYLCKIRTGEPNTRLCTTFGLAKTTLRRKLHLARECLLADFVPVHIWLDHITRTEPIEDKPFHYFFEEGDVLILDRGFRDAIVSLEEHGYVAYLPPSKQRNETQLTTEAANKSRLITMCRWVVETVNGKFKNSFKIFRDRMFNNTLTKIFTDFKIAAALINCFQEPYEDSRYTDDFIASINRNTHKTNLLAAYVLENNLNRQRASFIRLDANNPEVSDFPELTYEDLIKFAIGTYHLKIALSYCSEHTKRTGVYEIEVDVNNLEMVTNYQRKTDKGFYSKEKLQEAMRAVQNGELSGYKAARLYNIPRMTIMDHVKNKRGKSDTLARNTALSREVERKLASYLHLMERYGFGLTRDEVLEMVGEYVRINKISTPFNGRPGNDRFNAFKKRNNLSVKKPQAVEYARKRAVDPFLIYPYFDLLEDY
ncbi:hypothetical protein EVAR_76566_1 [Eumeta japonica]|uniref:HTH psq-type domain-containing protein n=1 Tax=Eumeta variegata TaxID=151549 RepID=A0A4C1T5V3_EUMVA|nr:hypothetical protein EVAR_76566_1 [Eumeta japonica]